MVGLFQAKNMMLVGIDKKEINDGTGSYFYDLCFSNGKDIIQLTAGKKADELVCFTKYNLGLNYIGKKLKLADFEIVK